ncbi:FadR family transcriptional regulator [Streptomyces sp. NA04227]|uniref:FadR/GntR family transcriptional regulator n=1 Tax=Streptomyces sp. NA04227 TaxID=2742136 RepID=UPI001590E74A|nr:FadR/GntR family transcriptional regulator [Streptomyces sp. NA04227]QKW05191.1 FadR family transcriptional regulator [Streptomyces sp. NA04227]
MSAVEKAVHGLRRMISSGRLTQGDRLPPEGDLCEELGVSRGSLREAVRMLAALGVVEPRHGSGTFVSPLRPADMIGSLSLTIELLPLDGVLELFEARGVLEAHVAAQTAARITEEELKNLRAVIETLEASDDPDEGAELDRQFHSEIARIAGNPAIASLLAVFRGRSRAYQVFMMPEGPAMKKESDAGHRLIVEALEARDPVAAAAQAAAHVTCSARWLEACRPPVTEAAHASLPQFPAE